MRRPINLPATAARSRTGDLDNVQAALGQTPPGLRAVRWIARPVRAYVAWLERDLKRELIELALSDLQQWDQPVVPPTGVEILPLPRCGNEWLLRRTYNAAAADSPDFRPAGWPQILSLMASPIHDPAGIFLAHSEGQYVGTCVTRLRPNGLGMVYSLAVQPEFRRSRLGRALLRRGLAHLRDRGAAEARLLVSEEALPARGLYQSEGFLPISSAEERSSG
jgi:ribosomal protein S18 acetylase RimI-like enzyme